MFAVNCNKAFSKGFGELQTQAKQEGQFLFSRLTHFIRYCFQKSETRDQDLTRDTFILKHSEPQRLVLSFRIKGIVSSTHVQQINFYINCDLSIVQKINIVLQTIALRQTG